MVSSSPPPPPLIFYVLCGCTTHVTTSSSSSEHGTWYSAESSCVLLVLLKRCRYSSYCCIICGTSSLLHKQLLFCCYCSSVVPHLVALGGAVPDEAPGARVIRRGTRAHRADPPGRSLPRPRRASSLNALFPPPVTNAGENNIDLGAVTCLLLSLCCASAYHVEFLDTSRSCPWPDCQRRDSDGRSLPLWLRGARHGLMVVVTRYRYQGLWRGVIVRCSLRFARVWA